MHGLTTSAARDTASDRLLHGLLLAASLLWCLYWFLHARGYWEDDAYIHLEFARSLSEGFGFSFNGRVVAGDTAPLWVLLLAAAHTLVPDWLAAGKLLALLGAVFGLAGIYAFACRMARECLGERRAQTFAAAIVLLTAVNPYTCYWIFSGMESIATAGLACWVTLAATRERPTVLSFLSACLLAGLGPLLRPEMIFLAALLALPLFGQWRRLNAAHSAGFFCAAAGLVLFAGPLLAWSLYSLHAFGHLLPNTNAAKRAGPGESVLRRLIVIYLTGLPVVLGAAAAGCLHLALHLRAVTRSLGSAVARAATGCRHDPVADVPATSAPKLPLEGWIFVLWGAAATVFYLADHTYVQTRYIYITAPGLTAIALVLALRLWPRAGLLLYAAGAAAALATSIAIVVPFLHNKAENCRVSRQLALFIRDRLPPDAPVAVYSIGQIAFESRHPIIDTGGITRPEAIPYFNAPPEARARWAQSEGAQYYIASDSPEDGAEPVLTVEGPFIGWTAKLGQYNRSTPVSIWKLPPDRIPPE